MTDKNSRSFTVNRIMKYVGRYRISAVLSLIFALLNVAAGLYVPILIGRAIDCIIRGGTDYKKMSLIILKAVISMIVSSLSLWLMNEVNNRLTFSIVRDMRNEAFLKIHALPFDYLDPHPSGDILSRITADVDQLADGLLMGFTQLFTGVVTILITLCFMFAMNPFITLIVVFVTPLSLFVARFISGHTYDMFSVQSGIRGEQTGLIDEMIGNLKTVKAFSYEDKAVSRFDEINTRLEGASRKALFYSSLTNPGTRFVNSIVYAMVALFGAMSVLSGGMSVGILTSFLSYANQYTKPFNEISGVLTELQNALACAGRVFEFMDEKEETGDAVNGDGKYPEGNVKCSGVDFSYDKKASLIENLNIDVKKGEHVAIVGPTGCGKTTIINLLMRFYDVDSGSITVDGTDIRDMTRHDLRSSYGMVLQDTWLRYGTIRDNLKMGRDISDEDMIRAAKEVHSHSFIRRLKDGYDTVIGEDGGSLSQGQKQLLCITRVMLSLPPMLILDEATSSIDTRTELKIQDAFLKMMEGRTSFIVAHRLSTIRNADHILVMKAGKIIEQGSHEQLLEMKGFYYELYNSQFA
ncbi:MAG: ABC transporter ATP-binding protein [Lachnospiraceae bacterium]|nr:ABC transporter ATP-binding protein [Lachnospiraceae bacterium]MBR6485723.1 ABC transporter ATP-binding protein [Lachnospiraceae bacterium]